MKISMEVDEYIENFCGKNYLQKERHELLFGNCMEDYHGYGGSNDEWANMNEFFD